MPISLAATTASATHGALMPIGYASASGSSNTVTFSNIPQIYQDLFLVAYARSAYANTSDIMYILLNNDSTALYSNTLLTGDGTSATSARESSVSYMRQGYGIPAATATASIFGSNNFHLLNYANTSTYKTGLWRSAADRNGAGTTILSANLYRSTSAITRLDVIATNGNFTSGSTFELFGIRTVGQ